jgi:hypothetical protein
MRYPCSTFVVCAADGDEVRESVVAASASLERNEMVDGEFATASALASVNAAAVSCPGLCSRLLPRERVAGADGVAGRSSAA